MNNEHIKGIRRINEKNMTKISTQKYHNNRQNVTITWW